MSSIDFILRRCIGVSSQSPKWSTSSGNTQRAQGECVEQTPAVANLYEREKRGGFTSIPGLKCTNAQERRRVIRDLIEQVREHHGDVLCDHLLLGVACAAQGISAQGVSAQGMSASKLSSHIQPECKLALLHTVQTNTVTSKAMKPN
jgi:hypothetical protein